MQELCRGVGLRSAVSARPAGSEASRAQLLKNATAGGPRRPEHRFRRSCAPTAHDGGMLSSDGSDVRVSAALVIPAAELSWRFSRSSGPGGQGVNTADSRVEVMWDATASAVLSRVQRERVLERLGDRLVDGVLTIAASEHRAQLRNRDAARARLAALVAEAVRPPAPPRRPTKPTRGSKERRLQAKQRRTDVKKMRRRPTD